MATPGDDGLLPDLCSQRCGAALVPDVVA